MNVSYFALPSVSVTDIDQMLDMVVDIYNNQFTKDDLLDRLHAPDAVEELQQQIQFIAQGQMDEAKISLISLPPSFII
jgi:hypothetical protein